MNCDRSIEILPSIEEISTSEKAAFARNHSSWRDAWTTSFEVDEKWEKVLNHIRPGEADRFREYIRHRAETTERRDWSSEELDHQLEDLLQTSASQPPIGTHG